jgi:hypothetical protein
MLNGNLYKVEKYLGAQDSIIGKLNCKINTDT